MFKHSEALGIPLDIIVDQIKEHDCVVDWLEFYKVSTDHGWNIKTTIDKIEYTLIDVYGKEYAHQVISILKLLLCCSSI